MKRLPFLDWTRGLAVLIMIQCHTFNCLVRTDLRASGPYMLSQFVGGMAAVLFLFLAGVTSAFQMDRLDRSGAPPRQKLAAAFRRAGYLLLLAYLFRANNALFKWPPPWQDLLKVDILNCMGAAMAVMACVALCRGRARVQGAILTGLAIACASPLIGSLDWGGAPKWIRDYLAPSRAAFALFPWGAYLAFGVAGGAVLRGIAPERLERTLQWSVLLGFALIGGGLYFSSIPYSLYPQSDFWTNSPALVLIRVGVVLLAIAGAYLWTEYGTRRRWSGVETMGRTSLLVYWVHVILVYGCMAELWRRSLTLWQTAAATLGVTALMLLLSMARLNWAARRPRATPRVLTAQAS